MHKHFLIFIFSIAVISCNQNSTNVDAENANGKIVVDTLGDEKIDRIFKGQLEEYMTALNGGDADKALFYVYDDMFVYMRSQYPDEKLDMEELKQTAFIDPIKEMKKTAEEKHFKYEIKIGKILKRVNYKSDRLYNVATYVNAIQGLDSFSNGGVVLGISTDGGKNWKFVQNDDSEMVGEILKLKYPQEIIDQVATSYPKSIFDNE